MRASLGRKEPFDLKYVEVGNEVIQFSNPIFALIPNPTSGLRWPIRWIVSIPYFVRGPMGFAKGMIATPTAGVILSLPSARRSPTYVGYFAWFLLAVMAVTMILDFIATSRTSGPILTPTPAHYDVHLYQTPS